VGSHVIAFLRPTPRHSDWSSEEIAELYRIEHALLRARIPLQTDRGITDEGDPWFVFCRADGEVLAHITRLDGQYYLYSPGLSVPLTGRRFTELSKSFVGQIPSQFPSPRADGVQLFVHPSAMLAIIIGTIFVASDDIRLLPADPDHAHDHRDHHVASSDVGVKASLQGAFLKYIDSFVANIRSEPTGQQSSYLNVMCAIASFIVGTSVATVTEAPGSWLANLADSDHQQHSPDVIAHKLDDSDLASLRDDTTAGDQVHNESHHSHLGSLDDGQDAVTSLPIAPHHSEATALKDDASVNRLHSDIGSNQDKNVDPIGNHASDNIKLTEATEGPAQQPVTSSAPHPAPPQGSSTSPSTQDSLAVQDNIAALSIDQLIHHVVAPSPVSAALETQLIYAVSNSALSTFQATAQNGASAQTTGALPMFDTAAQSTVINFLLTNPDYKVVYDHENVIVSDGHDTGSVQQVSVQVWELQSGATIAIVGHTNPVLHS
jgi:hypothetical protein